MVTHVILTTLLGGSVYCYHPYFTDEKTEVEVKNSALIYTAINDGGRI